MFGNNQDDNSSNTQNDNMLPAIPPNPLDTGGRGSFSPTDTQPPSAPIAPITADPTIPATTNTINDNMTLDAIAAAVGEPEAASSSPQPTSSVSETAPEKPDETKKSNDSSDDLLEIKQQALHQLTPLVGHLEQTPEEKFKTTMMMIQAADDQSLIKTAYEAAQAISDETAKAQALLDIVNEINYFTQHSDEE